MQKLRQLFASRSFEAVLKECDVAEKDEQSAAYEPQILYLRWEANRDLRKLDESDRWKRLFLDRYPNHTLAADMHLETAMNELVSGDYAAAKNELALIESQFPNAAVAPKVKEIRARMSTLATRTSIQQ